MKKVKIYIMLLALGLVLVAAGRPALAANYLEGIGVTRSGDSIVVNITTSAACQYNAFLTESKPERIVIDLSGVINDLPDKQFLDLPLRSINSIRTSQFKSEPNPQARVVLDIERPIDFRYSQNGNSIVIKLPAIANEMTFSRWESSASDEIVNPPVAPKVAMVEKPVEKPVTKPIEKPVEKVVSEPAVTPKPVAKAPVEVVEVEEEDSVIPPANNDEVMKPAVEPEDVAPVRETASSTPDGKEPIKPVELAVSSTASTTPGVPVDTTPKRRTVEYTASSLKDPFVPLIGVGKIVEGLPSLENLKLVGILENSEMNRALLEDGEGNGYILKPNDRVQSGYLVTVTENKAIFQVSEYGWTRTVALELEIPEIK
jgi:hypothetical protein